MSRASDVIHRVERIDYRDGVVVFVHLEGVWRVIDLLVRMEGSYVDAHVVQVRIEVEKLDEKHP